MQITQQIFLSQFSLKKFTLKFVKKKFRKILNILLL